jgi:hypothetical protein
MFERMPAILFGVFDGWRGVIDVAGVAPSTDTTLPMAGNRASDDLARGLASDAASLTPRRPAWKQKIHMKHGTQTVCL